MIWSHSALLARTTLMLGLLVGSYAVAAEMSPEDSAKWAAYYAKLEAKHPHGVLGTVDSVNAVTMDQIAQLAVQKGMEVVRKTYLGKIVTFKGLIPVGVRAKNEQRENVCMQAFIQRFPEDKYFLGKSKLSIQWGALNVYFNFGDETSEWLESTPHNPADLQLEHPLAVPFDVCDTTRPIKCHELDFQKYRRCIFSTGRLLVAGKVGAINADEDGAAFSLEVRPTGLRY